MKTGLEKNISIERNGSEDGYWYSESQGKERDGEIRSRYSVMIAYFFRNPIRAANSVNEERLRLLYHNDVVLAKDSTLRETLLRKKILNSQEVTDWRKGETQ